MLFRVCVVALLYALVCGFVRAEANYLYPYTCDSIVCRKTPEPSYSLIESPPLVISNEPAELPDKLALAIYVTALLMLDERNVEVKDWKLEIENSVE
ncbi:hypothetical protein AB4393_25070 [Vibrio splendidus]|nr:hypothetical protein BCU75_14215 [Vibrio splendidus]PMI79784.1 hypothetical protein BCU37_17915 [Vibrio splendidus]PMK15634.1 hypothetical protein BCU10_14320 [Vibrio splendidus]PMK52640.1 hypothetical protein BCT96_23425 [Vibrio splendidus]